jgi:hypothetical protein
MRTYTKLLARTVVLAATGWFAGCNGTIDDEPDVILEIQTLTIAPITSSQNGTGGTCTYTLTPATVTFKNLPKNSLAETSPFNDIILQSVNIAYAWDDGAVTPATTAGIGGAVPANGTGTGTFTVISNVALGVTQAPDPLGNGRAGHTASLAMVFNGATVSGDAVSATAGGTLQVGSCTVNFGACCSAGGSCSLQSEAACINDGGSYKGDGTSCSTSNICIGP